MLRIMLRILGPLFLTSDAFAECYILEYKLVAGGGGKIIDNNGGGKFLTI